MYIRTLAIPAGASGLRLAIAIATRGRPDVLRETLHDIGRQTRRADRVMVCHTAAQDVAGIAADPAVEFLTCPAGLTRQRNMLLDAAADCDVMLFFDDDFLPSPGYIEATLAVFSAVPAVAATTGTVIAEGAVGPGLSCTRARALISADRHRGGGCVSAWNGYGCNMAVRLDPVRQHGLRFDERLPLYGLYEDIDFTRQLSRFGWIARVPGARGVHLGARSGRTSDLRLGYAQVANAFYLAGKGTLPWPRALARSGRHVAKNALRSLYPEPDVDRRGRMVGNWTAIADLVRGRMDPGRILDL